jgi:tetratricopeptide (TPR) repeat protein
VIRWRAPDCADVAAPAAAASLLERALAIRPDSAGLRVKLADLLLDRYDFSGAAPLLERALALDPAVEGARLRLGRCYNMLRRHREALDSLSALSGPEFQRALAYVGVGLETDGERELRAVLAAAPAHGHALRHFSKLLRRQGRTEELADFCETLWARGVGHGQLLYSWGTALALLDRGEQALAILFDRGRVAELELPVPAGFADIAAFNQALAEEILTNPYRLADFPLNDEANRGSSRVHALFAGRRPELVAALLESLQALAEAYAPPRRGSFDPWLDARPAAAHLKAWGLIQRSGEYEEWHSHPGGWLSGVYYVEVPELVSAAGPGPGCIEFGPPPPVSRARPDLVPIWRHAPRAGALLLAPSHYAHRTIPTGADAYRISFAFDVVPEPS